MKITYTPNPLRTIVELDEQEIELFRLKIKIEQYEDMIFSAHFALTSRLKDMGSLKAITVESAIEEATKELDPAYWCDDAESKLDKRVNELLEHYLEELKGSHIGDCTCFAMSCSKCHAESKLGIDTIKGLGKHPGHKIQSAFSYKDGDVWKERTLEEALALLRDYDPTPASTSGWDKVGGYMQYVPRWKEEAAVAYKWLLAYRKEHFPPEVSGETRH
jgi:hypothetical protein